MNLSQSVTNKLRSLKLKILGAYFTVFKRTYKVDGLEFFIPLSITDLKFRARFVNNSYEAEERRYLKKYLPENATVLELGACLGVVSCLTNSILKNKSNHVVMEANPSLIDWIEKNRKKNHCGFKIESAMISPERENKFYIHDLIVGGSAKRKTEKQINVLGITIEELEVKHQLKFDTLIMDIEGGELDLLERQPSFFVGFKTIFMEVHPFANILTAQEAERCEEILQSLNFSLLKRDGDFQIWEKNKNLSA